MFKKNLPYAVAVLGATLVLGGCSNTTTTEDLPGDPDEWWNNPGLIEDAMATVGMAPLLNPRAEGPARTEAEADGRAKMAAVLKAKMNQLVENWSKNVGDLNQEASFSSYINNEAMTTQFVDAQIAGAYPFKYKKTQHNLYVLMVLKNPEEWVANLADSIRDQALKDDTLFKTEVMKNQFRERMDKLKNADKQKIQEQREKMETGLEA